MIEIVITVGLYVAAITLLVKSAVSYCTESHDHIVTEP